jgi:hypothetical protein
MTLYGPAGKMGLEDLSMRSQHVGSAILAEKIESENMAAGAAEGVPTGGTTEDSALMSFSPTTPSRPVPPGHAHFPPIPAAGPRPAASLPTGRGRPGIKRDRPWRAPR